MNNYYQLIDYSYKLEGLLPCGIYSLTAISLCLSFPFSPISFLVPDFWNIFGADGCFDLLSMLCLLGWKRTIIILLCVISENRAVPRIIVKKCQHDPRARGSVEKLILRCY